MRNLVKAVILIAMLSLTACSSPRPTPRPTATPLALARPTELAPTLTPFFPSPMPPTQTPEATHAPYATSTSLPARPRPTVAPTGVLTSVVATLAPAAELKRPERPQIGLNFIRFFGEDERAGGSKAASAPQYQPERIFADFADLGIHTFRQFVKADLLWDVVEPRDNQWNWPAADAVITNPRYEPVVTLFRLQYASGTPPWATLSVQFQKTLGPEAQDYLAAVIARYGSYVKYWELGNEMDHWRAADPSVKGVRPLDMPMSLPATGFTPREQGIFLAQVAAFIRQRDPDAVIVMPGMSGLDDYYLTTWLPGILAGGGKDWFDVINYHYYGSWERYGPMRAKLTAYLKAQGLSNKPVWMTETGSTSSPTLVMRTNYPNSEESQTADIFRRIIPAYAQGDALVNWHTYLSSEDAPNNDWRLYGIRKENGDPQLSYYAFKLLAHELIPFGRVDTLASEAKGKNVYKVTTSAGAVKYVAWGSGAFVIPEGVTQITSVVPKADGSYAWQNGRAGSSITLSTNPVLCK